MKPACYTMPRAPMRLTVKRREEFSPVAKVEAPKIVAVDRFTECHVTPCEIAARMVRYLGSLGDGLTLEPSAGTGNLSRALIQAGHDRERIIQVERHIALSQGLDDFGQVVNQCLLEYASQTTARFARVIMNPPFSDVRKHVAAALGLIDHGCLIALVPVTFKHDDADTLEYLDENTFATAKVRTKIIEIVRI